MKVIQAKNEDGKHVDGVLLDLTKYWGGLGERSCSLFEDMNDYGVIYSYDMDRNVFVHEQLPKKL